jgi:hypothetical protein
MDDGDEDAMKKLLLASIATLLLSCATTPAPNAYFDNSGRTDVLTGGVRMIPIRRRKGRSASGRSASATTLASRCCCCTAAPA